MGSTIPGPWAKPELVLVRLDQPTLILLLALRLPRACSAEREFCRWRQRGKNRLRDLGGTIGDRMRPSQPRKMAAKAAFPRKVSDIWVSEDCVVETVDIELAAHHAVFEPFSKLAAGTGNSNAETRRKNRGMRRQRRRTPKKFAHMSLTMQEYCEPSGDYTTLECAWWAHQGSNLGPAD